MASSTFFALLSISCVLHYAAAADKDGPCPSPAPAPGFNVTQLSGQWLLTHMTYDRPPGTTNGAPACVVDTVELLDDGAFIINSTFKRDGASRSKKYVPEGSVPGKFATYTQTDNGWSSEVFHHSTFVAFEGDAFLDFVCRDLGNNRHREFHRIRSRNIPVPQSTLDNFLQIARNAGDQQALYAYEQENCN